MTAQQRMDRALRRMAEYDLFCNLDAGREYTGFKGFYHFLGMYKTSVSRFGIVYDVTNDDTSEHHLLAYLEHLKKEKPSYVLMTSGSFLEMNPPLQKEVIRSLRDLSETRPVTIYVGKEISNFFTGTNVKIKVFDRDKHFIIHFIKSKYSFNFVMPHTEKKIIRVDMNSEKFNIINRKYILAYLNKLAADFDKAIERNKAEK
jgi:hypothetical protein